MECKEWKPFQSLFLWRVNIKTCYAYFHIGTSWYIGITINQRKLKTDLSPVKWFRRSIHIIYGINITGFFISTLRKTYFFCESSRLLTISWGITTQTGRMCESLEKKHVHLNQKLIDVFKTSHVQISNISEQFWNVYFCCQRLAL